MEINQNDILARAQQVLDIEAQAVRNIPLDAGLVKAVQLILNCKGKVVTSGMGKAGLIAQKIASTMSSTGTSAVFLHPGEAQHGDLGMLGKDDVLIVLTNSGRTREIVELVDLAEHMLGHKLPIIAITSHPESELKQTVDVLLYMGQFEEAVYHLEKKFAINQSIFNEGTDIRIKTLQVAHEAEESRQQAEILRLRTSELEGLVRGGYMSLCRARSWEDFAAW